MTSPFTQKHMEEIQINDLTPQQFLHLAVEASKSLGWFFSNIDEYGFTAYTANGIFDWNAEIKLKIDNNSAKLLSQSRNIRSIEFGKDKKNIENFVSLMNQLKESKRPIEFTSSYLNLQSVA